MQWPQAAMLILLIAHVCLNFEDGAAATGMASLRSAIIATILYCGGFWT